MTLPYARFPARYFRCTGDRPIFWDRWVRTRRHLPGFAAETCNLRLLP